MDSAVRTPRDKPFSSLKDRHSKRATLSYSRNNNQTPRVKLNSAPDKEVREQVKIEATKSEGIVI